MFCPHFHYAVHFGRRLYESWPYSICVAVYPCLLKYLFVVANAASNKTTQQEAAKTRWCFDFLNYTRLCRITFSHIRLPEQRQNDATWTLWCEQLMVYRAISTGKQGLYSSHIVPSGKIWMLGKLIKSATLTLFRLSLLYAGFSFPAGHHTLYHVNIHHEWINTTQIGIYDIYYLSII